MKRFLAFLAVAAAVLGFAQPAGADYTQLYNYCSIHVTSSCESFWAAHQPIGPSGTWSMDWHDEFSIDGAAGDWQDIDQSKWALGWFWQPGDIYRQPPNGLMTNCTSRSNIGIYYGHLLLGMTANMSSACKVRSGAQAPEAGALLMSIDRYTAATGVWEVAADYGGSGCDAPNWPAFWTNGIHDDHAGGAWPDNGEVDIAENGSSGQTRWNVHSNASWGAADDPDSGPSWCADSTRTYTMKRTSSSVCFWVDGVSEGCSSDASRFAGDAHYIVLEHAADSVHRTTCHDCAVSFDYVRHWN